MPTVRNPASILIFWFRKQMPMEDKDEDRVSEFEDYFGDYVTSEEQQEPIINMEHSGIDISQIFSGTLASKLAVLSEAIEEIDQLIAVRKALSKLIQERIDQEIFSQECLLAQVRPWQLGHNHSIELRRLGLEREILSLTREKRGEDVRAWEHIALLAKLKRQFLMEHQNLSATMHALKKTGP